MFWRAEEQKIRIIRRNSVARRRRVTNLLWAAVDLLQIGAEVWLRSLQGPGREQVPLLQQVDRPQGLHLQLWDAAQPTQSCRELGQVGERLQKKKWLEKKKVSFCTAVLLPGSTAGNPADCTRYGTGKHQGGKPVRADRPTACRGNQSYQRAEPDWSCCWRAAWNLCKRHFSIDIIIKTGTFQCFGILL